MGITKNIISFVLDGKITRIDFSAQNISPTLTLLQYLRSLPHHKGTKEGCAEGDCGACTVVLGTLENGQLTYKAVASCLIFLPMVHGKQVITIENLEQKISNKVVLHPIQQALIEENGTQCGFCTPGIAMSLWALLKNKNNPKESSIKDALSGNLCRCTGYKSIVKAARQASAAKNKDHFDKNESKIVALLQKISDDYKDLIHLSVPGQTYYKPLTLKAALTLKAKHPEALIVAGATDCALKVTKNHEVLPLIIDICGIEEIAAIELQKAHVHIGAAATIEEIKEKVKKTWPALYAMLSVFGSKQIRQMATLGGNVGSASPIGDTLPILFAYDAIVGLQSVSGKREIKMINFIEGYRKTKIKSSEIITHIVIPRAPQNVLVRSYKISKRKELDISTVSAAFRLELNKEDGTVKDIRIIYGGMAAYTKRASHTEAFLKHKKWHLDTIKKALKFLEKDYQPISDARAGEKMRLIAAKNLLKKMAVDTIPHMNKKAKETK